MDVFLHLGADVVVSLKQVVAILDLRTAGAAEPTREFLQLLRSEKQVYDISEGEPKSLVLTDREVYLSPISSLTLKKRGETLSDNLASDYL